METALASFCRRQLLVPAVCRLQARSVAFEILNCYSITLLTFCILFTASGGGGACRYCDGHNCPTWYVTPMMGLLRPSLIMLGRSNPGFGNNPNNNPHGRIGCEHSLSSCFLAVTT